MIIYIDTKDTAYSCKRLFSDPNACRHKRILVDRNKNYIECADCGEQLNPIEYLFQRAVDESIAEDRLKQLQKKILELENRRRFKCGRCGAYNAL